MPKFTEKKGKKLFTFSFLKYMYGTIGTMYGTIGLVIQWWILLQAKYLAINYQPIYEIVGEFKV